MNISHQPLRTFAAIGCAALLFTSCGSADDLTEPGGVEPLENRPAQISEQDIVEARGALLSGQADWEAAEVDSYTLVVGVRSIGSVTVEVVDGEAVSEEIEGAEVDDWFNEPLPRTVEELFAEVDERIAYFEDDPSLIPDEGDCGSHLNARFDAELGYPTYYDGLGPCDDGVGLSASVTNIQAGS